MIFNRRPKPTVIPPMGLSINPPLWQRVLHWFFTALGVVAFAAMLAVLLIEWMAGCGETYVDANGVRHQYECVFIPQPKGDTK